MKRKLIIFFMVCLSLGIMCGCQKENKAEEKKNDNIIQLYYLNTKGNGLVKVDKEIDLSEDYLTMVKNVLEQLKKKDSSKPAQYASAFNEDLIIEDVQITESANVDIYFGSGYHNLASSREVLVRASIVKTLVQLPCVNTVTFSVDNDPLTSVDGTGIGFMNDQTFIMDNDKDAVYDYKEEVQLYLSNLQGNGLVTTNVTLEAKDNISMETAVLEALKQTSSKKGKSPLPAELKINRVSVIQNICYVDIGDELETVPNGINDEVKIYAMVNSLTALSRISQVQITVNGEVIDHINECEGLDMPLDSDYSLVGLE